MAGVACAVLQLAYEGHTAQHEGHHEVQRLEHPDEQAKMRGKKRAVACACDIFTENLQPRRA